MDVDRVAVGRDVVELPDLRRVGPRVFGDGRAPVQRTRGDGAEHAFDGIAGGRIVVLGQQQFPCLAGVVRVDQRHRHQIGRQRLIGMR